MPILFTDGLLRRWLMVVVGVSSLTCAAAWAADAPANDMADIRSLQQGMKQRLAESGSELLEGFDTPAFKKSVETLRPEAKRVLDQMQGRLDAKLPETTADSVPEGQVRFLYFASWSLGADGLRQMFEDAAIHGDAARVVLRGIPKGEKLPSGLQRYFDIARKMENPPRLILDPTLFRHFDVQVVPTVIQVRGGGSLVEQKALARVTGLSTTSWLAEQTASDRTGDLGARGPVEAISEPDLIEVMKQRLAKLDWDSRKKKALDNFWANQKFQSLPKALEDRTRMIDPTLVVTADITDADGKVIVYRGTRINPLEMRPFNRALYVFDATDPEQVAWVGEQLEGRTYKEPTPVLMATRMAESDGWKAYESLTQTLDEPVYKLPPDVQDRWQIERVPSVVTAEGKQFKVKEVALEAKP